MATTFLQPPSLYGRYVEEILITAGDDVNRCKLFMKQDEHGDWSYSAGDVIRREPNPTEILMRS